MASLTIRASPFAGPARIIFWGTWPMEDLLWIAIMAGLLAATLAYARLCDNA